MTLNDAVKKMRGKPGTDIVLTIVRKGEAKPLTLTLTRAVIKIKSVKHKLVEPNYGYVRVTQFQEHSGENLVAALKDLAGAEQGRRAEWPGARSAQ
jgi:carboxyl-terminal processing protease